MQNSVMCFILQDFRIYSIYYVIISVSTSNTFQLAPNEKVSKL